MCVTISVVFPEVNVRIFIKLSKWPEAWDNSAWCVRVWCSECSYCSLEVQQSRGMRLN